MPRTTKTAPGQELANWDEELAKMAKIYVDQEANVGGSNFFSIRGGQLTLSDAVFENNEMGVVILDSILENLFFAEAFDPDNPAPPTCFAFGRDDATMEPHEVVKEAQQEQHETCSGCPMNAWATADTGRGKACKNGRRLAILLAGTFAKNGAFTPWSEVEHFASGSISFLKLPPTSVKGYAAYVKNVANVYTRPPQGVFTRIRVVPDAKTQVKVVFEFIDKVPVSLLRTIMQRHHEARTSIEQPYVLVREDAPPPPKKSATRGRPPTRGKVAAPVKNQRPPVRMPPGKAAAAAPAKARKF